MGNNTNVLLTALLSLLLSTVLAQFEPPVGGGPPVGKPCSSSFHCWRTEPINVFGEPAALQGNRRKRLEIGGQLSKGGRCRCIEGTCAQFQQRSQTFLACEEF